MTASLSTGFLYATMICYGLGLLVALGALVSGKKAISTASLWCMVLGVAAHTAALVLRTAAFGHPPITNLYEYMTTLAWFAAIGYFFLRRALKNDFASAVAITIILMLMLIVALLPDGGSKNLMPALRSYWLYIHVSAAAASEGLFAIGFGSSVLYLVKSATRQAGPFYGRLPNLATLDLLTYRMIVAGYVLFTLGALFAGAIWAHRAWGSFWSWDPKETSSLIVWIIYSIYLHLRLNRKTQGKLPHLVSILGFMAALATFFSSMFLGGMHAYG